MNEIEQMLMSILNCRRSDLYSGKKELTESQKEALEFMKARRAAGEPLQYIIGNTEFLNTTIFVDDRVLIPRPETEILVNRAIIKSRAFAHKMIRVLDLGTGSGNIAVAFAKNIRNAQITAVDISPEALEVAGRNAVYNEVDQQVEFICRDMVVFLKTARRLKHQYEFIISNPPYIKSGDIERLPEDVKQEPRLALDGGADGLYYAEEIIAHSLDLLVEGGSLMLELADGQAEEAAAKIRATERFKNIQIINDLADTPRIVSAQLAHR